MMSGRWVRRVVMSVAVLPQVGCGGWVDVDTGQGDGGSGGSASGASGSAGASTPADGYDLYAIPGTVMPGEDPKQFDIVASQVSENGELIVGTTWHLPDSLEPPSVLGDVERSVGQDADARYFYWTAGTGAQPWTGPHSSLTLSGDGSTIFTYVDASAAHETLGFRRWTLEDGFQDIGGASYVGTDLSASSYDGKRAAGSFGYTGAAGQHPLRAVFWEQGRWSDQVIDASETIAEAAFGWVSPEGSVSTVTSYGTPNHLYWAEGDDELELITQPASDCIANPASRDGRVVISFCSKRGGNDVYRWTAETRTFVSMGELPWTDWANATNPDGSALAAVNGSRLAYLKGGTTVLTTADAAIQVMGLNDDGSRVYLQQDNRATLWTESAGFAPLESLASLPCTKLSYPGNQVPGFPGNLAAGLSSTDLEPGSLGCGWSKSRAVVWDELGVRDIAAELRAAGVSLQGMELRRAERVWAGSSIRVMGAGELANGARRSWFAELPAR